MNTFTNASTGDQTEVQAKDVGMAMNEGIILSKKENCNLILEFGSKTWCLERHPNLFIWRPIERHSKNGSETQK